jgi:hypothetical protein
VWAVFRPELRKKQRDRAVRRFRETVKRSGIRDWGFKEMKTKFAASVLSALLYAQGLLGFAALATVLLKERAQAEITASADLPTGPSVIVVR